MNTTSLKVVTVAQQDVLNWFAQQEVAWGCFPYISLAYVIPVNCVIGLFENLAILRVLYFLKFGLGASARLYYALLAIFNILNLFTYHFFKLWTTVGLHFATNGRFYFSGTNYNIWFCRIFKTLHVPFSVLLMWTYVFLNIERVFAIAFPLRAKFIFTVRHNMLFVAAVGVIGMLLWIYFATLQQIKPTLSVIGPLTCLATDSNLVNIVFFQVMTNVSIFTLPPALNMIFGLLLLYFIKRQQTSSANLQLSGHVKATHLQNSKAIQGGIVVIIMAIVHSLINLPAGIFGCFYFM